METQNSKFSSYNFQNIVYLEPIETSFSKINELLTEISQNIINKGI